MLRKLKQIAVRGYVAGQRLRDVNYHVTSFGENRVKLAYVDLGTFWKTRNVVSCGKTKENVPINRLRGDYNTVIDVGAHIGIYSVLLGVLNPTADIYIYEPANPPQELLKRNLDLNNLLPRATISKIVVSDTSNNYIQWREDEELSSESHSVVTKSGEDTETRQTVALSNLFQSENINNVFLKIDAEGEEEKIIPDIVSQNSTEFIEGIVEIHPDKLTDRTEKDLISLFKEGNFEIEYLVESEPNYEHPRPIYWFKSK